MQALRKNRVRITTTGGAGVSAGAVQLNLGRAGLLTHVASDYHASAPATTDLVIKRDSAAGTTIFTNANSATDFGPVAVGQEGRDSANAAVDMSTEGPNLHTAGILFTSGLNIAIAQSNDLESAVVDVWWRPLKRKRMAVTTTGGAGTAVGTAQWTPGRPGILVGIAMDFHASAPATQDTVIKRDSTSGAAVFTVSNSSTDIAPTPLLVEGRDANNAVMDMSTAGGNLHFLGVPYSTGLFVDVAQSNALTDAVLVDFYYA